MKLKKGDTVIVTSGKEKGKKGKITRIYPEDFRIVVEGVNIKKRHRRATKSGEKGQTIEKQNPIAASKVLFVCAKCTKAVRVGYNIEGKTKVRVCKKCGAEV
jgi:large subunit ribosomal protein L24